jgi:hypothetical protein
MARPIDIYGNSIVNGRSKKAQDEAPRLKYRPQILDRK